MVGIGAREAVGPDRRSQARSFKPTVALIPGQGTRPKRQRWSTVTPLVSSSPRVRVNAEQIETHNLVTRRFWAVLECPRRHRLGAIIPDEGEPAASNRAGGYRQTNVAWSLQSCQHHPGAGAVAVRLRRSSNTQQQGGVSRVIFFPPSYPSPTFYTAPTNEDIFSTQYAVRSTPLRLLAEGQPL